MHTFATLSASPEEVKRCGARYYRSVSVKDVVEGGDVPDEWSDVGVVLPLEL